MKFRALQGRRDSNHGQIKKHLDRVPIAVLEYPLGNGIADLITHDEHTVFMEIKSGTSDKSRLKMRQLKFLATWPGYTGLVSNRLQAEYLARSPEKWAFNTYQKIVLLRFYAELQIRVDRGELKDTDSKAQVLWSTVLKAFEDAQCPYVLATVPDTGS